jgi:hypothetical protein
MEEKAKRERTLTIATNLGSTHVLPWLFLVFLVLP